MKQDMDLDGLMFDAMLLPSSLSLRDTAPGLAVPPALVPGGWSSPLHAALHRSSGVGLLLTLSDKRNDPDTSNDVCDRRSAKSSPACILLDDCKSLPWTVVSELCTEPSKLSLERSNIAGSPLCSMSPSRSPAELLCCSASVGHPSAPVLLLELGRARFGCSRA